MERFISTRFLVARFVSFCNASACIFIENTKALFPILLVVLKMVIFPVIAREIFTVLWPLNQVETGCNHYQNFTFLYASLPPAITAVVIAQSFDVMQDKILNAMLLSLLLCAPYTLIISMILDINIGNQDALTDIIDSVSEVMGTLSIICGLLLFSACIFHKQWRKFPMSLIGALVFCQSMFSFCKLPCNYDWDRPKSSDSVRVPWIYAGNCFFRYASHSGMAILSGLNAFHQARAQSNLSSNYYKIWNLLAPIIMIA